MPAERQWAADHCQSGTELRARCASESECECGSAVSEGVRLTTRREVDVSVCVCVSSKHYSCWGHAFLMGTKIKSMHFKSI